MHTACVLSKKEEQARIFEVGTANPHARFSQKDMPDFIGISDPKLRKFFEHNHIQYRYFYLPAHANFTDIIGKEKFHDLLDRFVDGAQSITKKAVLNCISKAKISHDEIDFICCVTSTGFIVPSLSARLIKYLNFREDCQRVDIVGMGCSAGLNGLNTVASWCHTHPNKNALLICVEICSAIYAVDNTPRTAVVNSLFGDGAAVALVKYDTHIKDKQNYPKIIDFESHLLPAHLNELRFDWDNEKGCYNFYVGKNTPRLISAVVDQPISRLLKRNKLQKKKIKHWILHGGGNSVLTGIRDKLNLSDDDLRHTRSVLRDFGNLSSGSFLFSFKRLIEEESISPGDLGVIITMGPGLAIELALLAW